jgi:hypothetical protein
MTDDQFEKIIQILERQKRLTAYIGLYITYIFWAVVIFLVIFLLALIF